MFREHPEYIAKRRDLEMYRDLYVGGELLKQKAEQYLVRRQREPQAVYNERLERTFYENYAGSIIDWYAATLFRREPQITLQGGSNTENAFYIDLLNNCDRNGADLSEFFRQQMTNAMVFGSSFTLIDFPRPSTPPRTRADEVEQKLDRGYLQALTPLDIIDWTYNDVGQLEWIVIRRTRLVRERLSDLEWRKETRFAQYDREHYAIYRQTEQSDGAVKTELVAEGKHGFARIKQVPVIETQVGDGLWMMRKVASLQLEHFNKSNALSWALTMGLYAMPVIYSDRDFKQLLGESYYIQLGPEDRFGWTEPEGRVYEVAANNLTRLQQEIYRICFLTHQGGPVAGNGPGQSGLSKRRDYAITEQVLQALGDKAKESIRNVLNGLRLARNDEIQIDVAGLDEFDFGEFEEELEQGRQLLELGIASPTLREQVFKKLALKYLCDIHPQLKNQICREIEEGVRCE